MSRGNGADRDTPEDVTFTPVEQFVLRFLDRRRRRPSELFALLTNYMDDVSPDDPASAIERLSSLGMATEVRGAPGIGRTKTYTLTDGGRSALRRIKHQSGAFTHSIAISA